MKVKDLIAELQKQDQELDVVIPSSRKGFFSWVRSLRVEDLKVSKIRPEFKRLLLLDS